MTDYTSIERTDSDQFEELRELMEEDFDELLQEFVDRSATEISSMQPAVSTGDCATLSASAHSLKSSSGNIAATRLHHMCKDIEQFCTMPPFVFFSSYITCGGQIWCCQKSKWR